MGAINRTMYVLKNPITPRGYLEDMLMEELERKWSYLVIDVERKYQGTFISKSFLN